MYYILNVRFVVYEMQSYTYNVEQRRWHNDCAFLLCQMHKSAEKDVLKTNDSVKYWWSFWLHELGAEVMVWSTDFVVTTTKNNHSQDQRTSVGHIDDVDDGVMVVNCVGYRSVVVKFLMLLWLLVKNMMLLDGWFLDLAAERVYSGSNGINVRFVRAMVMQEGRHLLSAIFEL